MKKKVLVTGGASGIGFAVAKKFSQEGNSVYLLGRDSAATKAAAEQIGAEPVVADVMNLVKLGALEEIFRDDGLDVLVNNAGICRIVSFGMYNEAVYDEHFHTNIRAPIFLTQLLLPALEKRKGAVINVSSVITRKAAPGMGIYAATKGALEAFTRNLAVELATRGVRVNAVCPGAIETPLGFKMGIPESHMEQFVQQVIGTVPMRRLGSPDEVAEVVYAQALASYVTGAVWTVDGGVDT